jgi:hypothetical protein
MKKTTPRQISSTFLSAILIFSPCFAFAQQSSDGTKATKPKVLIWDPPNVGSQIPTLASDPPCDLPKVLKEASVHAIELTSNLENFSAEEEIEFEMLDQRGFPEQTDSSVFEYVFAFEQRNGGRSGKEYRTPTKNGHFFQASGQDTGLVALALIFLPTLQSDYEMSCEGFDKGKTPPAWVIHFQQRKDKPRRTLQFASGSKIYSAMLKGRAWISSEKGQVLRMETNLMQDIPAMLIESSAISVDYAPVQIQSRNLELWLPERVEAYWQISSHKIVLYHTFRNFKLFAVDTEQNIQKPKTQ